MTKVKDEKYAELKEDVKNHIDVYENRPDSMSTKERHKLIEYIDHLDDQIAEYEEGPRWGYREELIFEAILDYEIYKFTTDSLSAIDLEPDVTDEWQDANRNYDFSSHKYETFMEGVENSDHYRRIEDVHAVLDESDFEPIKEHKEYIKERIDGYKTEMDNMILDQLKEDIESYGKKNKTESFIFSKKKDEHTELLKNNLRKQYEEMERKSWSYLLTFEDAIKLGQIIGYKDVYNFAIQIEIDYGEKKKNPKIEK